MIESPTLQQKVDTHDSLGDDFWSEILDLGTPLIEKCGDPSKRLVTFLFRAKDELQNVVLLSSINRQDVHINQLNRVKALTADRDGFSLNAAVSCQSYQRDRLERLCRYVTRPAISLERLKVRADGQIQYELKNPFSNGTTHILFLPLDFLRKLAALVPRPRHNLVRYHGVLAPNSKIRKLIVPKSSKTVKGEDDRKTHKSVEEAVTRDELIAPLTWAQRLKRVFDGAAYGLIFPYALCVGELCVSSDGAAFGSLTQT